jgi:putative alpha-1,2-mannosidase
VHVAQKLGYAADARMLARRSFNYRNCYDPAIGFVRPRSFSGVWVAPVDLTISDPSKQWRDFTESNSWQTTFGILHDFAGMIDILGGPKKFTAKLDQLFAQPAPIRKPGSKPHPGVIGQYDQGNEPSHHIAYLYTYAGHPAGTQQRIRAVLDTMYTDRTDGLPETMMSARCRRGT